MIKVTALLSCCLLAGLCCLAGVVTCSEWSSAIPDYCYGLSIGGDSCCELEIEVDCEQVCPWNTKVLELDL